MCDVKGTALGLIWTLPFAGILLSIALLPLAAPKFWHAHFGKVAAFWTAAFLGPFAWTFGASSAAVEAARMLLLDYVPFILLLFALYVVAGGIRVAGELAGTPGANTAMLALGTLLASLLGTTGAAMLLIRPLIRANERRPRNVHVFVFFIFLVANIGGSLTPLGDPPLFLGFLQGVRFSWTLRAMLGPMLLCASVLLALFFAIDHLQWRREGGRRPLPRGVGLQLEGGHNLALLAGVIGAVLMSGLWESGAALHSLGISLSLEGLLRDATLALLALLSWMTTPRRVRVENAFAWEPIQEVAALFAAIFLTGIPGLAMLSAGSDGPLAPAFAVLNGGPGGRPLDFAYFWLTGALSSFLDNAPTYLVFFNLAGGDPELLMGPLSTTLLAISSGSVFFGALTYVGNAPNFLVKSICEERGIRMPTFFGYLAWSCGLLLPLFALVTRVYFWR